VIAALPECWKMNFEEVGIALCHTLTDEPDLLNRVISSLESAVLDEIVRRQEMVLQREGADELQNGRAIAAFIRCWGAGEQKRSLSPRSTTSQIVPNPQVVRANGSPRPRIWRA
jgi:hypothetical protein